jgi:hypothetical protein
MDGFAWDGSDISGVAEAAGSAAILGVPAASADAGGVALGTGSGQHGVVPVASASGPAGYVGELRDWLAAPFVGGLSPSGVFLLVGIILVAIIAWNLILYHIRIAAEEI